MPQEMSLDEFASLAAEKQAPTAPPAAKEMSLEDFDKVATQAPEEASPEATPTKISLEFSKDDLKPPTLVDKAKSLAVGALKEVATLGDMVIGVPGGVASSIGELAMQADMSAHGISRASGEAAAKEFGAFIADKTQPKVLSNIVAHLAEQAGEPPSPSYVEQGMAKLNEWIDKGAEFIDTKTGGKLTKAEVQSEANLLLNLIGAKALAKGGNKLVGKAKEEGAPAEETPAAPEVKEPIDPKDGNPTPEAFEALATKLRPATKAKMMSEKDLAKTQKAWGDYLAGRTEVEAARIAKEEHPVSELPPKPKAEPTVEEHATSDVTPDSTSEIGSMPTTEALQKAQDAVGTEKFEELAKKNIETTKAETDPQIAAQVELTARRILEHPRLNKQSGGASTDMLKTIAGAATGLAVVSQLDPDNPMVAGVIGALAGVGAAHASTTGVKAAFSALTKADTRVRINKLTEEHQLRLDRMDREVAKTSYAITKLVPKKADRQAIHKAIDEGKVGALTGDLAKAAAVAQKFYGDIATEAQKLGVLESARANYSTHIWDNPAAAKGLLERKQAAMSASSRFNKQRAHLTMADGIAAGLKPKTTDIAEIMAIYGSSIGRSMATAKLIGDLHQAVTPKGERLLMKAGRAPKEYVTVDSPSLRAYRVHPDIAPSLKFAVEADNPGAILSAMVALNTAIKRNQVSLSLFHAKSLLEAGIVAGHPFRSVKVVLQAAAPRIFGTNKFLDQVRKGGAGDLVDDALKGGLKLSFEKAEPADLDVGGGFYHGMSILQKGMDKILPGGIGKGLVKGYVAANHMVDNFMWGRLHTGLKLEVWAAKKEGLLQNNAKAGHPISADAAGRMAATYANDVFGGLNWGRLAENSRTKWGRDTALALNSRTGRMVAGVLLFAPDWTLSTLRAFYKAIPGFNKGNGLRGILRPRNEVDLYRQQLVRFGMYYVTALNAINMATSGHPIWENKDKTRIDLGDGRTMQAAKHSFEAFHAMSDPSQTALSKLGTVPKEIATQALNVEYLSAHGHMPPMKSRAAHLTKSVAPISVGQFQQGVGPGVAGFLGAPIYGKNAEMRREAAKARRAARHKKLMEQYRRTNGLDQ